MKFPILFKKTTTGAQQEWAIWTAGNTIFTRWGQTGGAMQNGKDVIKKGKNIGKANETTPSQQAELEAKSEWEKKKKRGYVEDAGSAMKGETDAIIEGGIFPMLAQRFDEHAHKIKYPAYVQPKLDGHRCIIMFDASEGRATMWSRTRKPITGVPHIARAVESLGLTGDVVFDGELYHHDYRSNFDELTSFIRQQKPKEGHEVVQYHCYDIAMNEAYEDRLFALLGLDGAWEHPLQLVPTHKASDEDELMGCFERFLKDGYEGAIVRNAKGPYVNKRSYDLQKIKEFADSEFKCVGVKEGRGKLVGHAIFTCETEDGQKFDVKMAGETSALKKYWTNQKLAIGKMLTVKYQGLTSANGVPRFPVALRFREDV